MKKSAGLPLSVGQASLPVRLLIASVFLLTAILCVAGGVLISETSAGRVLAIVLVIPVGETGSIAAAFVLAPHSRFGRWLDHFVTRLREPVVAVGTAAALWLVAFAVSAAV